jgi:hypothetical protein
LNTGSHARLHDLRHRRLCAQADRPWPAHLAWPHRLHTQGRGPAALQVCQSTGVQPLHMHEKSGCCVCISMVLLHKHGWSWTEVHA